MFATITVQAILLAIALSLDSLGTGLAYGMRRLALPASTYLLLAGATGFMMTFSMLAGASLIGPAHAALASALLGLALGLDAFAAGFGTGMLGFPLQIVPTVAIACPLLLGAGTALGGGSPPTGSPEGDSPSPA